MSEPENTPEEAPEADAHGRVTNETAPWEDIYARMHKRLDEGYPPAWMHDGEIGATLVGYVAGVKPSVPTQFGPCPVVTIAEPETGTPYSLWLTHTVLKREFVRQQPAVGELIAVRYEGQVRPDSGGPAYENYTLVVDRPDQADADWNAIGRRYNVSDDRTDEDDRRPLENRSLEEQPVSVEEEDIPF